MADSRETKNWGHKATQISSIDFNNVEVEYMELISNSPREEDVQKFLENNCYLLLQPRNANAHSAVVTKPKLADEFVADFVMFGGCNNYWLTLVEIEKPSDQIFTKSGNYSSAFTHALRQVSDWSAWIRENGDMFNRHFSRGTVKFEIIIGRRNNLTNCRHRLQTLDKSITVSTFDSLIPNKKFGHYTHDGLVQKDAITYPEYKQIYNIGTGKDSHVNPWFLYWLWEHGHL
jgi:hypothetical protein